MCKILRWKNEILKIKETLTRYRNVIPGNQKPRFDKDLLMIFQDVDNTNEDSDLTKIEKLAKTKLKSIQRIYGTIRDETKEEANSLEFFPKETEELLVKAFNLETKSQHKSKFKELKSSFAFNPENIKKYQKEYNKNAEFIAEAYTKAMDQIKQEKESKNEQIAKKILAQDSDLDINKCRDKDGKIVKEKLQEAFRDIMVLNKMPDRSEDFDYDSIIKDLDSGRMKLINEEKEIEQMESLKDVNIADTRKSEDLFSVFSSSKKYSDDDVNKFVDRVKPILENRNLTDEQKQILLKKELKKAEDEWNRKNMDGVVGYNMYGQLEVTFYKEKTEDSDTKEKVQENNGIKNFVWREGKLVEGKAVERKAVTYSNWHPGHHNPDDLRRHRDLLDRQHYGGPLWEGIKYQSIMNDKSSLVVTGPTPEYMELLKEMTPKNTPEDRPKKEIIEIVR